MSKPSSRALTTIIGLVTALAFLIWFMFPHFTKACDTFSLLPVFCYPLSIFAIAVVQATRAQNTWQLFGYWLSVMLIGAAVLFGLIALFGLPLCSGT